MAGDGHPRLMRQVEPKRKERIGNPFDDIFITLSTTVAGGAGSGLGRRRLLRFSD
ncbi:hypothetical protein GCM10025857_08860 [Alicyclobacillus contaminans]|nr:hypothetical protein GCM10025857_08860 [Alicyclobacillus contaminans]